MSDADPPSRMSPTAKGRAAEEIAAALLVREGYRLVERNARAGRLEIDVVAWDDDVLCFVEVRRRDRIDDALASVTPQKQQEVTRAASRWLVTRGLAQRPPRCRFDVVVVSIEGTRLLKNAFESRR